MIQKNLWRVRSNRLKPSNRAALQRTAKDRSLTHRLHTAIERDLSVAQIKGLQLYVKDGAVTLYGTIRHTLDRDMLQNFVARIPGVILVKQELQVVDQPFQIEK